jgi:hypothetical protein
MRLKCLARLSAIMMFAFLTVSAPGAARGDDILVQHDQPHDSTHFPTIQQAIDQVALLKANQANINKSYRILVKADAARPYEGPITLKTSNVPIIGESTASTIISGGTGTLISASNLTAEIRNLTFKDAPLAISVSNNASISITNNIFRMGLTGTAILVQSSPATTIINNTFYQNGTAINTDADIVITNDIFSTNKVAISTPTSAKLSYNDFFTNDNVTTVAPGSNSLPNTQQGLANPNFVDPTNQANPDFHLKSDSPCINSGNPLYHDSFDGSISDMGAYGGTNADIPPVPTVTNLTASLSNSNPTTMTLTWDPTTDNRVTAYRVYFGPTSGTYQDQTADQTSPFLVPRATPTASISGIPVPALTTPRVPPNAVALGLNGVIKVSWTAVADATGYEIFYGTAEATLLNSTPLFVEGGSTSSAQVSGLSNGTHYFLTIRALNQRKIFAAVTAVINSSSAANARSANESPLSVEASSVVAKQVSGTFTPLLEATPEPPIPFPNLKGEGCFIATAAFGFYSAPQVQALRDFRDRFLLTNAPGRAFVTWYYHYGPKGAHFINLHPWLKAPVRLALLPLIVASLVLTGGSTLAKTGIVLLAFLWLALWWQRKNPQHSMTRPSMMPALKRSLLPALLLMVLPSLAQGAAVRPDRPHWSLELKGGAFFPDADNWSKYYGSSYIGEYGGALAYKLLRQVEVGIAGSYMTASGKGLLPTSQTLDGEVTFERAPLDLFVLGRALFNEDQLLVPYLAAGYTRLFYREEVKGQGTTKGSVNGYHARAGVQLLLDGLESDASRSLYLDYGIHHTYLFLEGKYLHAQADTVSSGSVNLGGTSCLGGFLFEF